MPKAICWAFVLLLSHFVGVSQSADLEEAYELSEIADSLDQADKYNLSVPIYLNAMNKFKSIGAVQPYFDTYEYYLNALGKLENLVKLEEEMKNYETELATSISDFPEIDFSSSIRSIMGFWVNLNVERGNLLKAEELVSQLIRMVDTISNDTTRAYSLRNHNMKLAEIKFYQGSFQSCIEVNGEAFRLMNKTEIKDSSEYSGVILKPYFFNVKAYQTLKDSIQVEKTFQDQRYFLAKVGTKKNERAFEVYQSHFDYYLAEEQQDSVSKYITILSRLNKDGRYDNEIQEKQALKSILFDDLSTCIVMADRANQSLIKSHGIEDVSRLNLRKKLVERLIKEKEYDQALVVADDCIDIITGNQKDNAETRDRKLLQTLAIDFYQLRTNLLFLKYQSNRETKELKLAWTSAQTCTRIIQVLRNSYNSSLDRIYLVNQSYRHYETALEIAFEYYQQGDSTWIDTAFTMMEQCKALDLLDITLEKKRIENSKLPDHLTAKFHLYSGEINDLQYQVSIRESKSSETPQELATLQSKLHAYRDSLQSIMDSIHDWNGDFLNTQTNPQYYWTQVKEDMIKSNRGFIEYFSGAENLFSVSTNGTEGIFVKHKVAPNYEQEILGFLKSITSFGAHSRFGLLDTFQDQSILLYNILFKSIPLEMPKRLLIIPDGGLRMLPFNALLTDRPASRNRITNYPFLLDKHAFSYSYSYTLHRENKRLKKTYKLNVDAIAPLFYGDDTLAHSIEEVEAICKIIPGQKSTGKKATKNEFYKLIQEDRHSSIIHLSTHASANRNMGNSSFIRFYDHNQICDTCHLTAFQLSQLKMPYHMAVLSACETADGEVVRGEGVVGLSRAFFESGVESLIASLWQVNDQASKDIQIEFYRQLKKGKTKDIALQNAQIRYLQTFRERKVFKLAHPFYWAAMVPVGDMNAFEKSTNGFGSIVWIGPVCILIILIGMYWKNRKVVISK